MFSPLSEQFPSLSADGSSLSLPVNLSISLPSTLEDKRGDMQWDSKTVLQILNMTHANTRLTSQISAKGRGLLQLLIVLLQAFGSPSPQKNKRMKNIRMWEDIKDQSIEAVVRSSLCLSVLRGTIHICRLLLFCKVLV